MGFTTYASRHFLAIILPVLSRKLVWSDSLEASTSSAELSGFLARLSFQQLQHLTIHNPFWGIFGSSSKVCIKIQSCQINTGIKLNAETSAARITVLNWLISLRRIWILDLFVWLSPWWNINNKHTYTIQCNTVFSQDSFLIMLWRIWHLPRLSSTRCRYL